MSPHAPRTLMKLVRFLLVPPGGALHPVDAALADAPNVRRRAIHHLQLLEDGSAVTLYEVEGDEGDVRAILEASPHVTSFHLTPSGPHLQGFVHFQPGPLVEALLRVRQRHELLLQMPLEYTDEGALRLVVVGDLETIRRAVPDVPEGLGLELQQVSEYEPDVSWLYADLTEGQQRTLRAAVEHGYYEEPRRVGYRELAEELDLSPATVGEHLRKAEAKVLGSIVP